MVERSRTLSSLLDRSFLKVGRCIFSDILGITILVKQCFTGYANFPLGYPHPSGYSISHCVTGAWHSGWTLMSSWASGAAHDASLHPAIPCNRPQLRNSCTASPASHAFDHCIMLERRRDGATGQYFCGIRLGISGINGYGSRYFQPRTHRRQHASIRPGIFFAVSSHLHFTRACGCGGI